MFPRAVFVIGLLCFMNNIRSSALADPENDDEYELSGLLIDDNDSGDNLSLEDTSPMPLLMSAPSVTPPERSTLAIDVKIKCYSCIYNASHPLEKSCLQPNETKQKLITCNATTSMCFTYQKFKDAKIDIVRRGCTKTKKCKKGHANICCDEDKCNSNVVNLVTRRMENATERRRRSRSNKTDKPAPQTVLFFVTILLVLQTVVKVAIV